MFSGFNITSRKLKNLRSLVFTDPETRSFKRYIRKNFNIGNPIKSNAKILVESGQASSNLLSLSLFLPLLSEVTKSELVAYSLIKKTRTTNIKESIRNRFSILFTLGAIRHLIVSGNSKHRKEFEISFASVTNASQLESLAIEEVKIGDLIYDTYLRQSKHPTINFTDPLYKSIFMECVEYFYNLKDLFEKYEITAVCVSHTVYHFAIPVRLAISRNVPAFQVTGEAIYRLNSENTHAYTEFKFYKQKFEKLTSLEKERAKEKAKVRLDMRLSGEVGVDMPYSTASAFSNNFELNLQSNSEDTQILVATHDFFDSPHSFGDNLFPDFYIWLETLGEISIQTDYKWFIKSHRDSIADDSKILEQFIRKYPKFTQLNPDTTHQEIVGSGVRFVLTVFGTVAMEYPLLGGIAINASLNNPHADYSFSVTPSSKEEYIKALLNLKKFVLETNLNEVYEYYAMAHILNSKSWIYYDYDAYIRKIGGYQNSISPKCFKHFILWNQDRRTVKELQDALRVYLKSGDYKLNFEHFEKIDA